MAPEPPQSVVLASSSSHNERTLVSLPFRPVEETVADMHPHPGPVAPSLQDDVRPPIYSPASHPDVHTSTSSSAYLQPSPTRNVAPFSTQTHRGGTLHPISRLLNILACPVVWSVNTLSPSRPHFLPTELLVPPRPVPFHRIPASTLRHQSHPHTTSRISHPHLYPLACTFTPQSPHSTSNTTCVSFPPSPIHTSRQPFLPNPPLAHHCPIWGSCR